MKYSYILTIDQTKNCEAKQFLKMFYIWLIDKVNQDYETVKEKEYSYLVDPFDKSKDTIIEYNRKYEKKYIYMETEQVEELNEYLEHTKNKYSKLDSIPYDKKNIQHYNRLLSWYSKTPKNIDCIVEILIQSSFKDDFRNNKKFIEYSNQLILRRNKGKCMYKNNNYKTEVNLKGGI